ncbi:ABC transporter ATP-binding protein [Candidatus Solirubrobacter pratensis]|uniref:ABC transporter ATP-binding protein n=1 Tax=Candidatus Solirubrobacter pratensis TaxID=1298857 RepID=UPI000424E24F|nr:ABC transporter ATP-binding protein [Candidatus Solirubrobacter pratensis]
MIDVRGLRMTYGDVEAVRGVDLQVATGEVVALLGPNGAGKTTTVEILEGFRTRTGGEVTVLGADPGDPPKGWRERVGIVLQEPVVEPQLTVRECLAQYAGYYARPRPVEEVMELVGLSDLGDRRCGALSGGQQRRIDVGLALVGDPELIFLDEPTTGFDPSARRAAWQMIAGLRDLGTTIVLTTHYMDEAERLADRIVVLARGLVVAEGTPGSLGGRDREAAVIAFTSPSGTPLPARFGAAERDGRAVIRAERPLPVLRALADWAEESGAELGDLEVRRPTLEDVYLQLVA